MARFHVSDINKKNNEKTLWLFFNNFHCQAEKCLIYDGLWIVCLQIANIYIPFMLFTSYSSLHQIECACMYSNVLFIEMHFFFILCSNFCVMAFTTFSQYVLSPLMLWEWWTRLLFVICLYCTYLVLCNVYLACMKCVSGLYAICIWSVCNVYRYGLMYVFLVCM